MCKGITRNPFINIYKHITYKFPDRNQKRSFRRSKNENFNEKTNKGDRNTIYIECAFLKIIEMSLLTRKKGKKSEKQTKLADC